MEILLRILFGLKALWMDGADPATAETDRGAPIDPNGGSAT